MNKKNNYVVRKGNHWGYRKSNSKRLSKITKTQMEAYNLAKANSKRNRSTMFVQGKNRHFRMGNNYGYNHY